MSNKKIKVRGIDNLEVGREYGFYVKGERNKLGFLISVLHIESSVGRSDWTTIGLFRDSDSGEYFSVFLSDYGVIPYEIWDRNEDNYLVATQNKTEVDLTEKEVKNKVNEVTFLQNDTHEYTSEAYPDSLDKSFFENINNKFLEIIK